MKALVLSRPGVPDFTDHADPEAADGLTIVDVRAATLNAVDIAIAAGTHYLSPAEFPVVSGIEGAGVTPDGRRVYFGRPVPPFGSMAQRALVPDAFLSPIPDDVDFAVAATLGNAGMAALMPLSDTGALTAGENVLILGGTGVVGRLAVQAARLLGAGTITVFGRDVAALEWTRELGATHVVSARGQTVDELVAEFRGAAGGVDVIVDYTWGEPASAALRAGNRGVRLVQIGDRAGSDLVLPAQLMRSLGAQVTGFMPMHSGPEAMGNAYRQLLDWAQSGSLAVDYECIPLADAARAWEAAPVTRHKLVFVP